MPFNVNIKNLGKLTEAEIRLGKFTVFAGPNNTGKSYVSKALYSLFGAMNANHLAATMGPDVKVLRGSLRRMARPERFEENIFLQEMTSNVSELQDIIGNISVDAEIDEFSAIEQTLPEIFQHIDNISSIYPRLREDAEKFMKTFNPDIDDFYIFDEEELDFIEKVVASLQEYLGRKPQDFVVDGLKLEIKNNFLQNFQVPRLSNLYSGEEGMSFGISDIGNIKAYNSGKVNIENYTATGLHQLQKYSRVMYLESPIHWRMMAALDMVRKAPRFFFSRRDELPGVPKYVYDMYDNFPASQYGEDTICSEVLNRLISPSVLGGKVVFSNSGELSFQEENSTIPLSLAAMGVANLGMLAFLMERNLLDENTFLFVDEPEAHLHPAWQVEMVKALYALSKEGVNVVIATHSADIMKWLEVHVKENGKSEEEIISLNHFCGNGIVLNNSKPLLERLNVVQEELATPFFNLYYKGL